MSANTVSNPVVASTPEAERTAPAPVKAPVVFFDGVCGLCNASIDFILKRDRAGVFRFAPLQGETAAAALTAADIQSLNSLVLRDEQGRTYRRSSAIWRILWRLGPGMRLLGMSLWCIPKPLRDLGYRMISANRYRMFGKKDACRLPTPAERARFLP